MNLQLDPIDIDAIAKAVREEIKREFADLLAAAYPTKDELLTTEELAAIRKCSKQKLERERMSGDGPPFIKADGARQVRYSRRAVDAWLAGAERQNTIRRPK